MDHTQAVEHRLVEQYLLQELPPQLRDEFEEHFFDCLECAADLRATGAFLDAARTELRTTGPTSNAFEEASRPRTEPVSLRTASLPRTETARRPPAWRFAFGLAALAATLLLAAMLYQQLVTLPRLRSEMAALRAPELLPVLSLAGGASRGGSLPSISSDGTHAILLQFDIPAPPIPGTFTSYRCSLYSSEHQLLWSVPVSAKDANDTVSLRVPFARDAGETYLLEVRGQQAQDGSSAESGVVVANYRFSVDAVGSATGH